MSRVRSVPLFRSAKEAVEFALSCRSNPARPVAAQASMILSVVKRQGRFPMAVMTAGVGPRFAPCSCRRTCCSGTTKNLAWDRAIEIIAKEASNQGVFRTRDDLRDECVRKLFGAERVTHRSIAKKLRVDEGTVGTHFRALRRWLRGGKATNGHPPDPGIETTIWQEAEDALRSVGLVG